MKFWLPVALLLLLCAPFVVAQQRVDEVSEAGESLKISEAVTNTTEGVKALNLFNDAKRAKELFQRAIESDSTYAPARYMLAGMQNSTQVDSAFMHSKVAYMSDTTNMWYLGAYAQSAALSNKMELAQSLYEKILEGDPRDINAYRILAILHNQQNRPLEAIRVLDTAAVRVGANPYLEGMKRQFMIATKQYDRVIEEARVAVEDEPYSIENRVALAELYRDLQQDSSAMVEYKKALALDSTRIETLVSMSDFFKKKKEFKGYISLLGEIFKSDQIDVKDKIALVEELTRDRELYQREYLAIGALITTLVVEYPNNEQVIQMQASYLISRNMLDEALVMLKSHLDVEPPSFQRFRMVIDIERFKERTDSVEYYLSRAMERFPEEDDLKMEWGYTLTIQNRFDEAIELYESYLDGASDSLSSSIWGTIGDVHHQAGISNADDPKNFKRQLKQTYKAYDKALEFSDENTMVLNNYAYFLCEYGGDMKRALAYAERCAELEGGNATFIDTYAWILYKLGRYDEAKVQMRRAISLDTTKNSEIALHYAQILAALDETTMANYYWGKALEWGMTQERIDQSKAEATQIKK